MPRKNAPEFSFDPKTKLYRKKIKNPITGKWIPIYGKTKNELRQKIKDRETQFARQYVSADNPAVYQYAAKWYALHTTEVGAKRRDDYRNAINNHICPVIGAKLVSEVTYDDILAVMAAAKGLSKSSQQKIVTTLKRIFESAVKNDLIQKSPCYDLKPGGAEPKAKVALTKDQQARLLEAVRGTKAEVFVHLCLFTGLRREEALGMRWDCVHLDDETPYLSVRRAVHWEGKNKASVTEELKSKAAYRDIPLPDQLLQMLKAEKEKSKSDYLIPNSKGQAMSATSFRKLWDVITVRTTREVTVTVDGKKQKKELQIGDKVRNHNVTIALDFHVTPHLLRHTYITELVMSGANIKTVQYLAGHKNVTLTLEIYTHLMENKPSDTAGAVIKAFGVK